MSTTDGTHGTSATTLLERGEPRAGLPQAPGGALETFRLELGDLWGAVRDRCVALDDDGVVALSRQLEQHLQTHPLVSQRIGELANDLMALMAGWQHFGAEERAVLVAAMAYLADADDVVPDHLPGGLDDDDHVVGAAVRAVLRPRRRVA
ncbi:hypothetical protein [Arsenicicoccus sp. oral taxon 190]|uniref:hypothetical protein n=1 Tax=Arsenicicoccus sp. oral taxon 190 TaxID=1658671 RepID=UPI00067A2E6B|nr:hypothetical protein [Arsenicicoccus sp. oral taxon 190]AKT51622.1 hypothetical protein ADJ73_10510 [Arsenicicoccus sp. oral taxon 190]